MNSNRVSISTELDNSGIEKGAREIKGELGGIEGAVNDLEDALKSAFSRDFDKSIANANARVNELQRQLSTASSALKDAIADGDDAAAEKYGNQKIRIYDQLEAARERLANAVRAAAQREANAEEREVKRVTRAKQKETEKQLRATMKPMQRFGNRLRSIVSGALVFNLLSAGLRTLTQYFGSALKSNQEFTASVAKLKGALMTSFQPIYQAVLPALLTLIRILTAAIQVIGQFLAILSGQSTRQMAENAEALNKEADAINGVGGAAKEAKKQLAGFDEINKLNANNAGGGGGGSTSIAPDFEAIDITDKLKHILRYVGAVAAALLAWKIASSFTTDLKTVLGLALTVGGAFLFITNLIDAWANGIDWQNLRGMLIGMIAIAGGLYLAFGAVGAAIGLLVTGVLLAIVAMREWIETGELTNEGCVALVLGILAIGAAISLLTGSWIPLLIAAIGAFVLAAVTKTEELKKLLSDVNAWLQDVFQRDWTETLGILGVPLNLFFAFFSAVWQGATDILIGFIDFIAGVFAGDWEQAWTGVENIFKGIFTAISIWFDGIGKAIVDVNAWIQDTLQRDWTETFGFLGNLLNIVFAVIRDVCQMITDVLSGLATFISGVFAGDWEKAWSGIVTVFSGIFGGIGDILQDIANGIIDMINALIRGIASGLNGVIGAANKINIKIPHWVPVYGGKSFGLNLAPVSTPQIPHLARGAVIPPNAPFMAMLGDQRHGTNIEAPLSTIQEAVALVMEDYAAANLAGHEATVAVLRDILEAVLGIEIGDDVLGKAVNRYNARLATMRGDG